MFDPSVWRIIKRIWFGPSTEDIAADQRFWWHIWSVTFILMLLPWTVVMIPYLLFTFLTWACEYIREALDSVVDMLMNAVRPRKFPSLRDCCDERGWRI